jgi:hypothetical protein
MIVFFFHRNLLAKIYGFNFFFAPDSIPAALSCQTQIALAAYGCIAARLALPGGSSAVFPGGAPSFRLWSL